MGNWKDMALRLGGVFVVLFLVRGRCNSISDLGLILGGVAMIVLIFIERDTGEPPNPGG